MIGELRVVGDPRAAERHCEEDEDDSDMVSDDYNLIFKATCDLKGCTQQKHCLSDEIKLYLVMRHISI